MVLLLPKRLIDGYANFRSGRYSAESERYRSLGDGMQKPKIMLVACCDSRAAPETIFDASPGEIFVVRNVANLVPPYAPDGKHHSTSAALEFAILALEVEHVVIMGHGRCGGIRAMVEPGDPLSSSDFIGRWMADVVEIAAQERHAHPHAEGNELHRAVERASVEHSIANLRTFPWIRARQMKRKLSIHGAWFDISEGTLWAYDEGNHAWGVIPGA
jgi:carbonic anhydrase